MSRGKMFQSILQKSKALLGVGGGSVAEEAKESKQNDDGKQRMGMNPEVSCEELKDLVYDYIRTIRDPEKPATLEDLHVLNEDCVKVQADLENDVYLIHVEFIPTVPHCSLATLIGLCIRVKLERSLIEKYKLDISIKSGTHTTEHEINKQINDKERIAAAMENPNLSEIVESCIQEAD